MVGVSTYLALTFSTLLSSQGTDASFVLTLSGFPPGASLRYFVFPTLPDPFPFRFRFGFHLRWPLEGLCLSAGHYVSGFSSHLIIEVFEFNSEHAERSPAKGSCWSSWVPPEPAELQNRVQRLGPR
ncbi:hypothetical protein CH313_06790 [Streptomyces sp. TSRI0384-2]|nr:hypothetical protein CH313_06790 [Streptomyces sp. TSRI0384-2]